MAQHRLTDVQAQAVGEAYGELEVLTCEKQAKPVAAMLIGQEGSGRHALMNDVAAQLNQRGGYVSVEAEQIRVRLPYYSQLDTDGQDIVRETREDVQRVSDVVHQMAVDARRNIVVEAAQSTPEDSLRLAKDLLRSGYQVEVHALSVNDQISYQRATAMYEADRTEGRQGVYVSQTAHERGFKESSDTLRRLEYAGAVDRVVVYNRLNDVVVDQKPEPGKAVAAEAFERGRHQLTDFERINLAERWDQIAESMAKRGANESAVVRVREPMERAHYTLRSSRDAADNYDYRNPTERNNSQEMADRYGHKLADAFKDNRRSDAQRYPELTQAFVRQAQAEKIAESANAVNQAASQVFVKTVSDKIASGLRHGEELKPVRIADKAAEPAKVAELAEER